MSNALDALDALDRRWSALFRRYLHAQGYSASTSHTAASFARYVLRSMANLTDEAGMNSVPQNAMVRYNWRLFREFLAGWNPTHQVPEMVTGENLAKTREGKPPAEVAANLGGLVNVLLRELGWHYTLADVAALTFDHLSANPGGAGFTLPCFAWTGEVPGTPAQRYATIRVVDDYMLPGFASVWGWAYPNRHDAQGHLDFARMGANDPIFPAAPVKTAEPTATPPKAMSKWALSKLAREQRERKVPTLTELWEGRSALPLVRPGERIIQFPGSRKEVALLHFPEDQNVNVVGGAPLPGEGGGGSQPSCSSSGTPDSSGSNTNASNSGAGAATGEPNPVAAGAGGTLTAGEASGATGEPEVFTFDAPEADLPATGK